VRPNVRTALTSSTAWLIGAATSVGVALIALSLIGDGLSTHGVSPLTPGRAETMAASDVPATSPTTRPHPRTGSIREEAPEMIAPDQCVADSEHQRGRAGHSRRGTDSPLSRGVRGGHLHRPGCISRLMGS
jgi:hypothetical protein